MKVVRRTLINGLPVTAIALESAGFLIIAAVVWLNQLLNLPHHLFGAPVRPFSLHEAIMESGLVLMLGVIVVTFTARLVRQLDRFIVLCAWCRRVRLDTKWVKIEEFFRIHRADTSHGICPECAERIEEELPKAG